MSGRLALPLDMFVRERVCEGTDAAGATDRVLGVFAAVSWPAIPPSHAAEAVHRAAVLLELLGASSPAARERAEARCAELWNSIEGETDRLVLLQLVVRLGVPGWERWGRSALAPAADLVAARRVIEEIGKRPSADGVAWLVQTYHVPAFSALRADLVAALVSNTEGETAITLVVGLADARANSEDAIILGDAIADSLRRQGDAGLPALERARLWASQTGRRSIAMALGSAPRTPDSEAMLVRMFERDTDPWVQGDALLALSRMEGAAPLALSLIARTLESAGAPILRSAALGAASNLRSKDGMQAPLAALVAAVMAREPDGPVLRAFLPESHAWGAGMRRTVEAIAQRGDLSADSRVMAQAALARFAD